LGDDGPKGFLSGPWLEPFGAPLCAMTFQARGSNPSGHRRFKAIFPRQGEVRSTPGHAVGDPVQKGTKSLRSARPPRTLTFRSVRRRLARGFSLARDQARCLSAGGKWESGAGAELARPGVVRTLRYLRRDRPWRRMAPVRAPPLVPLVGGMPHTVGSPPLWSHAWDPLSAAAAPSIAPR